MSDEFELVVQLRTDKGKGASRRLRRTEDLIPAIMYGAGKDPELLSIPHKDLHKALENEAFFSHIVTINTGESKAKAIIKDLQRHPAKDRIMHVDFYRVSMDQKITVEVPIHFINEEDCVGVKLGDGAISHLLSVLEINCLPNDLPEFIEVDVAELNVGDSIYLSQIALPEGAEILALAQEGHDNAVVSVHMARVQEEVEEAAPEAAAAEGETPAAETPEEGDGQD